ncbi:MAG TPA: response regulator [Opitutaceae bacterium]|nr:response regulator [Opitutaceae bacterium]
MKATHTQTILLVEDEENDVLFMEMAFEKTGLAQSFQVAEDGQEAIDYLSGKGEFADRTRHPLPALVFLDLKLPRVMGMDVLKWIREQPEMDTMVVIVLTSSQQKSDIQLACSLGANSYLVKPSNPFQLTELVELVKRYWLQLNQPTATLAASRLRAVSRATPAPG